MTVTVHHGDCRDVLPTLPAESVHCVVTSPPYFGLRSYLPEGHPDKPQEIGAETDTQAYVDTMVAVFRAVRRALRPDGAAFLNIGDCYAGGGNGGALKPKDLCLIPWRVALALQEDGWWVRSTIAWTKSAPMPESVADRPTSAWEPILLLAKSERYFWDGEAVREGAASTGRACGPKADRSRKDGGRTGIARGDGLSRNLRNVWSLGPDPYAGAHFAVMPREVARRCIKAGTSERGCCPHCGAPWARVVANGEKRSAGGAMRAMAGVRKRQGASGVFATGEYRTRVTVGWRPSCTCPGHDPIPCTVLDPFFGAGTTGVVAAELGRHCIGIELSEANCRLASDRLRHALAPVDGAVPEPDRDHGPLFVGVAS